MASPGRRIIPLDPAKPGAVREWLESLGVTFPPGAYASVTKYGKLVVRNSEENLRAIEKFLDGR
jgi:hypothetical protein